MSWWIWMALGFVAGRFGEAIVRFAWKQAHERGWVK